MLFAILFRYTLVFLEISSRSLVHGEHVLRLEVGVLFWFLHHWLLHVHLQSQRGAGGAERHPQRTVHGPVHRCHGFVADGAFSGSDGDFLGVFTGHYTVVEDVIRGRREAIGYMALYTNR